MCQPKDIFLSIEFMVQCHVLSCVPTATTQLFNIDCLKLTLYMHYLDNWTELSKY